MRTHMPRLIGRRRDGRPIYLIAGGEPTLEELRTRRGEIQTRMQAIHQEAGDEALSDEQAREWDQLDTEQRDVDDQITEKERRERVEESRRHWSRVQVGDHVTPYDGEDVTRLSAPATRDRARAVLDQRDGAQHLSDGQRSHLERLLTTRNDNIDGTQLARRLLVTEHPDYREAFMRLVTRNNPVLSPEQSRAVQAFEEFRAMSVGTGAEGGFGVPVLIDPTIILTAQGHPNDFFNLARVETITTNAWKGVSSAGVTWQFRPEAGSATDNSPTLDQPEVNVHRADGYIPYSFEVEGDYPGFASEMQTLLAEGYSELLVDKFTTGAGDGSNEPFGIVTALTGTSSEVDNSTTGELNVADVNGLWEALPIKYRSPTARTAWMSSTNVNNAIGQLGAGNDAGFTVDFTAEGVMVLKGRQARLNDYMASLGAAATGLAVVGDWRNYLIAQRAGMSVELIPHVFDTSGSEGVPTGQRAWFAWARVGADSINNAGFRMLSDDGTT